MVEVGAMGTNLLIWVLIKSVQDKILLTLPRIRRLQGQVSILDIEEMVEAGAMGTNLLIWVLIKSVQDKILLALPRISEAPKSFGSVACPIDNVSFYF
jgi:hypothetical protein